VLREGLDLPEVSHIILATVMGSLRTFLQSVGRGLRKCEGKDKLVIQDHGGCWWRHGSVNADREWNLHRTENMIAGMRADAFREKKIAQPICCPKCQLVRASGPVCPTCGHESSKGSRMVMQQNGALVPHEEDFYPPRRVREFPNTQQIWTQNYYRAKNSKNKMTFNQAVGLMFYENHYYPPKTLPLMPIDPMDWYLPVASVPRERLRA
jgi:superfamily II DNA or RNA helicase